MGTFDQGLGRDMGEHRFAAESRLNGNPGTSAERERRGGWAGGMANERVDGFAGGKLENLDRAGRIFLKYLVRLDWDVNEEGIVEAQVTPAIIPHERLRSSADAAQDADVIWAPPRAPKPGQGCSRCHCLLLSGIPKNSARRKRA